MENAQRMLDRSSRRSASPHVHPHDCHALRLHEAAAPRNIVQVQGKEYAMSTVETPSRMLPTDRIAYSAIAEREKLKLPGGARMAIWVIVNVEEWDPKDTMPRTVLTPPAGGSPSPDIPNWCWHEYGNRVGFWRMLKVFDEFQIPGVLAINGCAIEAFPPIVKAAIERKWEFIGHGYHPAQHAEGAGREGRYPPDHGRDRQGHRQATARLARPRPDRDLADARSAERSRLRLRRRLGARRSAGLAQNADQADCQHPLHPGVQRRGDDADPAPQGVGIL